MKYKIFYTKKAYKSLQKLSKTDSKNILDKISFFSQNNPMTFSKKLHNPKYGTYRFRIGNYRAIFDLDDNGNIKILMILDIKHRKDIYKS